MLLANAAAAHLKHFFYISTLILFFLALTELISPKTDFELAQYHHTPPASITGTLKKTTKNKKNTAPSHLLCACKQHNLWDVVVGGGSGWGVYLNGIIHHYLWQTHWPCPPVCSPAISQCGCAPVGPLAWAGRRPPAPLPHSGTTGVPRSTRWADTTPALTAWLSTIRG